MEPWQQNEEQVGRRRVGIPMRRRRRLCGWCGRCAPSWAPITGRCAGWGTSWVSAFVSVRKWVRQADIDDGAVAGTTTADRARIGELESENRELRRANAILKSASAFFAAELDRPLR